MHVDFGGGVSPTPERPLGAAGSLTDSFLEVKLVDWDAPSPTGFGAGFLGGPGGIPFGPPDPRIGERDLPGARPHERLAEGAAGGVGDGDRRVGREVAAGRRPRLGRRVPAAPVDGLGNARAGDRPLLRDGGVRARRPRRSSTSTRTRAISPRPCRSRTSATATRSAPARPRRSTTSSATDATPPACIAALPRPRRMRRLGGAAGAPAGASGAPSCRPSRRRSRSPTRRARRPRWRAARSPSSTSPTVSGSSRARSTSTASSGSARCAGRAGARRARSAAATSARWSATPTARAGRSRSRARRSCCRRPSAAAASASTRARR